MGALSRPARFRNDTNGRTQARTMESSAMGGAGGGLHALYFVAWGVARRAPPLVTDAVRREIRRAEFYMKP